MSRTILVVGGRGVGKNSFCRRVQEHCWDGRIEESLHLTTDITVNPQAVIIMFSLGDTGSFVEAARWYWRARTLALPMIFVGSKYDLEPWKVTEAHIERLRDETDFTLEFFPVSAKKDILVERPINYLLRRMEAVYDGV